MNKVTLCIKCGVLAGQRGLGSSKYCGDGSDKDNEHRFQKVNIPIIDRTRELLQQWIDKQGHERCWYYPEIFNQLIELYDLHTTRGGNHPPEDQFAANCERYRIEEYRLRKYFTIKEEYCPKIYYDDGRTLIWGKDLTVEERMALVKGEIFTLLDAYGKPLKKLFLDNYNVMRESLIKGEANGT